MDDGVERGSTYVGKPVLPHTHTSGAGTPEGTGDTMSLGRSKRGGEVGACPTESFSPTTN